MKEDLTYELLLNKVKAMVPFSWSRFGDGEWNCILQKRPGASNCDGHEYFPDLGKKLKDIVESQPSYFIGLQNLAKTQNEDNEEFKRLVSINEWCENELLHRASIKGYLNEFIQTLDNKPVIVVGNESLKTLSIKYYDFVSIPDKNCWLSYPSVRERLLRNIIPHTVILYCASMMSNVLIDDLYGMEYTTQIDCGSVFDPYAGRNSRSYMKKLSLGENLVGRI